MSETETVAPFAALVQAYTPAQRNDNALSAAARNNGILAMGGHWTMEEIYRLPNGGAQYTIVPMCDHNPKHSGEALWLWTFYGTRSEPKHTVASLFVTLCGDGLAKQPMRYPTNIGSKGGTVVTHTRVRSDLIHGLRNGLLGLRAPDGKAVPASVATPRNSFGTRMNGGNYGY